MLFSPLWWKCCFMHADCLGVETGISLGWLQNLSVFCTEFYVQLSEVVAKKKSNFYFLSLSSTSFPSFYCHPPFLLFFYFPHTLTHCLLLSLPLSFHLSPRTESVAEKMLTNWFTFLLYKFLKVKLSHSHTQHIHTETHTPLEAILIQLVFENRKMPH